MSPARAGAPESRRTFLTVAGAGIAAGALAACGSSSSSRSSSHDVANRAQPADIPILNGMLDLEHKVIAAYTAGIPLLSETVQVQAKSFLGQELSHAGELAGLVKQAGGKPHQARASYDLGQPRTHDDVLSLLLRLEQAEIAGYLTAIEQVSTDAVRAALAASMANDAQHLALVRSALALDPMPTAFVGRHR